MNIETITKSPEETKNLGRKIGSELKGCDIVALFGELGAGKTTLIQGIAEGVHVADYVTSPTFIIINEFKGRFPFYHIDLYRLEDISQIEDLGIAEYFGKEGVKVIEWAEKLGDLLPKEHIRIEMEIVSENERRIKIT